MWDFTERWVYWIEAPVSSHWIANPESQQNSDTMGVTDLPIWSGGTFTDPPTRNSYATAPNSTSQETRAGTTTRSKIKPKRIAPSPPNKKNSERGGKVASVEYEVPVISSRWYNRKQRTHYKELDLNQVQRQSTYAKPHITAWSGLAFSQPRANL